MAGSTFDSTHTYRVRDMRPHARGRTPAAGDPVSHQPFGERTSLTGHGGQPWDQRLRRALRGGLFELRFQPIAALADGTVSHYEALLRLADVPGGALVAPTMFLPAAERCGLVVEIDQMVLSRVLALMGRSALGERACVAVNLSAVSVTEPSMLAHIESELERYGVDPAQLVIEVTETAAIRSMRTAAHFCERLNALGCAVALDDFGAGFGSLQYLKRLHFDFLKIDGDFVRSLPSSHNDQLVVRALVGVARGMGKRTIAEYVGDERTFELLRALDVDFAQGYHVGRPQPLCALSCAPRRA
jgi:EAL domain-containing protein (putative c-di-GMP-specific phosphodiesterase class I)